MYLKDDLDETEQEPDIVADAIKPAPRYVPTGVRRGDEDCLDETEQEPDIVAVETGKDAEETFHAKKREANTHAVTEQEYKSALDDTLKSVKFVQRWVNYILMAVGVVATWYVVKESAMMFIAISALPIYLQYILYSVLGVLSCALLYVMIKAVICFYKLRTSSKWNFKALEQISTRNQHRQYAAADWSKYSQEVFEYLNSYPTEIESVEDLGVSIQDWEKIQKARTDCLALRPRNIQDKDWIANFRGIFQACLDDCISAELSARAKKVGLATAVSPFPLVDRLIVFTASLDMMKYIMSLYNIKPTMADTLAMLAFAMGNTYLSGLSNKTIENEIKDMNGVLDTFNVDAAGGATAEAIGMSFLGGVMKWTGKKAAEALINGLLFHKLGKSVQQRVKF